MDGKTLLFKKRHPAWYWVEQSAIWLLMLVLIVPVIVLCAFLALPLLGSALAALVLAVPLLLLAAVWLGGLTLIGKAYKGWLWFKG